MVRFPRHDFGSLMTVPNSRVRSIPLVTAIVLAVKFTSLQRNARSSPSRIPVMTAVAMIGW